MNKELARLFLDTKILGTGGTPNKYGVISSGNISFTFYNIDMCSVLGTQMWNKYKNYKVYFTLTKANTPVAINYITIDGLNLYNNLKNKEQIDSAPIIQYFNTSVGFNQQTINPQSVVPVNNYENNLMMIRPYEKITNITFNNVWTGNGTQAYASGFTFGLIFEGFEVEEKIPRQYFYDTIHNYNHINFTLMTNVLTLGESNKYGYRSENGSENTFFNIPLRDIMSPIIDKYDKFNVWISCVETGIKNAVNLLSDDNNAFFQIDGIPFINNYNMVSNSNGSSESGPSNRAYIGYHYPVPYFVLSDVKGWLTNCPFHQNALTIMKPSQNFHNITFRSSSIRQIPYLNLPASLVFGNYVITINIIGIEN
jgi:hypothetical protein